MPLVHVRPAPQGQVEDGVPKAGPKSFAGPFGHEVD